MEGIQFNIELTAIIFLLAGLSVWIFKIGRKSVTNSDLSNLNRDLREYIGSKVSKDEATARHDDLRDDLRELKELVIRTEEHIREDQRGIGEDIRQIRSQIDIK